MGNYFIYSDVTFDQNADYSYTDIYDPAGVTVDLSTYTAQAMIRVNKTDTSPILTFATGGTGLVLNAGSATGAVQWAVTNAQITTLITKIPGLKAFFNIILFTAGGLHVPFKAGALTLTRGATF